MQTALSGDQETGWPPSAPAGAGPLQPGHDPGIAALIRTGGVARAALRDRSREDAADSDTTRHDPAVCISASYRDLDHFTLTMSDTREPDKAAAVLTLSRRRLFFWRVTEIDIPSLQD
jgi:hypothetical protein